MTMDGREVLMATRIAKRSIWIMAGMFALILVLFMGERLVFEASVGSSRELERRAAEARLQILLADEILTDSARSSAAAGMPEERGRYETMVKVMDAALAEARSLASADNTRAFIESTSAANDQLIALEAESFDLAGRGRYAEALAIMLSADYVQQKEKLKHGIDRFLGKVSAEAAASAKESSHMHLSFVTTLLAACAVALVMIWISVSRSMNRSEAAYFAADKAIRDELAEVHEANVRNLRMAQMGQLAATVAHELRNPLGAVRASAFLLARKIAGKGLGADQQIERINNGVSRCDEIITQLLDFSRASAPNFEMRDFDEWLVKAVEDVTATLPPSLKITCDVGLNGQQVMFDEVRMRRAIVNLVNNASEAMFAKNGSRLPEMARGPEVRVVTRQTPAGVELRVEDNGPGISPENIGKIMEPLFTTKSFGTGLGLPAVAKIFEQHGGTLECQSVPGEGTQFVARFPARQPLPEAAAA